jgi:hypothetical protein
MHPDDLIQATLATGGASSPTDHRPEGPALAVDRERAAHVGRRLCAEFASLIDSFPTQMRTPSAMARWLGLQQPLCSRLLSKVRRVGDGVEVLMHVPGVQGLGMFVEAARARESDPARLRACEAAIVEFGDLLRDHGGSRRALAAMLRGAITPERVRGNDELHNRAAAFEANAALMQCSAHAVLMSRVYSPSRSTPGMLDLAAVAGRVGFERSSYHMPAVISYLPHASTAIEEARAAQEPTASEKLFEEFCSKPVPHVRLERHGTSMIEIVEQQPGGGAVDIIGGPFFHAAQTPFEPRLDHLHSVSVLTTPARWLVSDIYLQKSVAARVVPRCDVYAYGALCKLNVPPATRWFDRLPGNPTLVLLGRGLANAGSPVWARHGALTKSLFERAGVDPDEYVGTRLLVPYPIWSAQYVVLFEEI